MKSFFVAAVSFLVMSPVFAGPAVVSGWENTSMSLDACRGLTGQILGAFYKPYEISITGQGNHSVETPTASVIMICLPEKGLVMISAASTTRLEADEIVTQLRTLFSGASPIPRISARPFGTF